MTRGGREKDQDEPERKCIATGETSPKAGLVRFVVGPDGAVVPDFWAKLPGRGIYVSADRQAIGRAAKKGLFARAARMPVKARRAGRSGRGPAGAAGGRAGQSMARKAGDAVTGYEKVKDWLVSGRQPC
jgi:predicted RNA-binding protein YlxR (DUF448 family)